MGILDASLSPTKTAGTSATSIHLAHLFDPMMAVHTSNVESLPHQTTAVMLASLPASDKEAGSQHGVRVLEALAHYFGRSQALWKPVATEGDFEIVRRRLFASLTDQGAAEAVCRAFADEYTANRNDFPQGTQEWCVTSKRARVMLEVW